MNIHSASCKVILLSILQYILKTDSLLLTWHYLHISQNPLFPSIHGVLVSSMISQMMKPLLTKPGPVPHGTLNTSLPLKGPDAALSLSLLPFRLQTEIENSHIRIEAGQSAIGCCIRHSEA